MKCQFCEREITNAGSLKAHEIRCKNNPHAVKFSHSKNAGAKKGCTPWNKGKQIGRTEFWDLKYSNEIVFSNTTNVSRGAVKRTILRKKLIEYKCSCCGILPHWNGSPMVLVLDHINGIRNDNRLENLRFVCSNCNSQLPTFTGRNKKCVI